MVTLEDVDYYTVNEMSCILNISGKAVSSRLSDLNIKKSKTLGSKGYGLYTHEDLHAISRNKEYTLTTLDDTIDKCLYNLYNKPLVITYYIYESKMNS